MIGQKNLDLEGGCARLGGGGGRNQCSPFILKKEVTLKDGSWTTVNVYMFLKSKVVELLDSLLFWYKLFWSWSV